MKIALACQSILLEKSLEIFLKSHITPFKQCDFVISDKITKTNKPLFHIGDEGADLVIPFSRSALMISIERFYDSLSPKKPQKESRKKTKAKEFEKKIERLTDNFRNELIDTIKKYYAD